MQKAGPHWRRTGQYWDSVADRYLELFRHELQEKPYDRDVIIAFTGMLSAGAPVCDAGCGPCAHVTRLLADAGLDVALSGIMAGGSTRK